jgi:hypothetical protein
VAYRSTEYGTRHSPKNGQLHPFGAKGCSILFERRSAEALIRSISVTFRVDNPV